MKSRCGFCDARQIFYASSYKNFIGKIARQKVIQLKVKRTWTSWYRRAIVKLCIIKHGSKAAKLICTLCDLLLLA